MTEKPIRGQTSPWLGLAAVLLLCLPACASLGDRLTEVFKTEAFVAQSAGRVAVLEFREGGLPLETDLARLVRTRVQEELARWPRLTLVANDSDLKTIFKAQDTQLRAEFDPKTIVQIGKLAGAEFALSGELSELAGGSYQLLLKMYALETGAVVLTRSLTLSRGELPDPAGSALSRFPTAEFLDQIDAALPQIAEAWKKAQPAKGVLPLFAAHLNPAQKKQSAAERFLQARVLGGLTPAVTLRADVLGPGYNYRDELLVAEDLATPVYAKSAYVLLLSTLEVKGRLLTYTLRLTDQRTARVLGTWTAVCEANRTLAEFNGR